MNEKEVLKRSVYIFIGACILIGIVSIVTRDISYLLGLILGYIINILTFYITIKSTEALLQMSSSAVFIALTFLVKIVIYAVGLFMAIKLNLFHILGVFIGYMLIKVAIYIEGYRHKGGD